MKFTKRLYFDISIWFEVANKFTTFVMFTFLVLFLYVNTVALVAKPQKDTPYIYDTPPGKDMPPALSSRGYRLRDFSEADLVKRPQVDPDIPTDENTTNDNSIEPISKQIVAFAVKFLGVPYKWGGTDPKGFDCSGFAMFVYDHFGYIIPHGAGAQFLDSDLVAVEKLEAGDLVFYKINKKSIGHVGIYVGDDKFIHSPKTGKTVEFANMKYDYWKTRYAGARRVKKAVVSINDK